MQTQQSKLPLVFGILLILAGPLILVMHFASFSKKYDFAKTEAKGPIVSKEAHIPDANGKDSIYLFHVSVPGTGYETVNELENTLSELEKEMDQTESKTSTSTSSDKDVVDATMRKQTAENETTVTDNTESPNVKENLLLADVTVTKEEYNTYKTGDSVNIQYDLYDLSTAKLKMDLTATKDGKTKKADESSWYLVAGAVFLLGVILIVRSKKRAAQEQQQDVLSTYSTVSTIKKKDTNTTGRPN